MNLKNLEWIIVPLRFGYETMMSANPIKIGIGLLNGKRRHIGIVAGR